MRTLAKARNCGGCGKSFRPILSYANRGDGKCCSKKCVSLSRHKTPHYTPRKFWEIARMTAGINECWLWPADEIYPRIKYQGKRYAAHRLAYILKHGQIPAGLLVCHSCDVTRCCNPRHLFAGTQKENQADMVSKDRQAKGEKNSKAKLTENLVREILLTTESGPVVARRFNVSTSAINYIRNRRTWRHVNV